MPVDPKPARRIIDRDAGKAKVRREGRCRSCQKRWPLSRAHLVGKDLGGDDVEDNIVPLCGHGTSGCHGRHENRELGWRSVAAAVRESLTVAELDYVLTKKGIDWLDRYWPNAAGSTREDTYPTERAESYMANVAPRFSSFRSQPCYWP